MPEWLEKAFYKLWGRILWTFGMKLECLKTRRKSGQKFCKKYSLSAWPPILDKFMESRRVRRKHNYLRFISELLQRLYFKLSKFVKEYTVNYLSPDRLTTGADQNAMEAFVEKRSANTIRVWAIFEHCWRRWGPTGTRIAFLESGPSNE